ncbi:MAG: anti-sigma factor [Proteobacteria bacterium]|nr:anti-sigma factor [Pseudomonadota bacterium]
MNHKTAMTLLPAGADGQLGPFRRFLLDRHIARCTSCRAEQEALHALSTVVRTSLPVHRAPPSLAARIGAALPREAPPEPVRTRLLWPQLGFGVGGALAGAALTLALMWTPAAPDRLATEAVANHVRSMLADHLTDVTTSDQHTVKPWLSARLDFSPVAKDFTASGYPLVGGRLDYIDGHQAAAIVYRRDRHIINLFVYPSNEADALPRMEQRDGFHIVRWRSGGLKYIAVSDVEAAQLQGFVTLVRQAAG